MKYEIKGDTLPVVICYLDNGEKVVTEGGGMSYGSKILSSYSGNVLSAVYSVIYNATFSIPETVLSLVMVVVLISIKPIRKAAGIK